MCLSNLIFLVHLNLSSPCWACFHENMHDLREADTIPTDSVPTDAIPTIHSQDDPVDL